MELLDGYFRSWSLRADALKVALDEIRTLPKGAQVTQAGVVRNACLAFIKDLEVDSMLIVSDYNRRKNTLFADGASCIVQARKDKKSWPYDAEAYEELKRQKKLLSDDVVSWATEAVAFEKQVHSVQELRAATAYQVIGELISTYGIAPRVGKKKP